MVPVVSPLQAALAALIAAVGNAAVVLGFISTSNGAQLETGIVGVIAALYPLLNAVHHATNVKAVTSGADVVVPPKRTRKAPAA